MNDPLTLGGFIELIALLVGVFAFALSLGRNGRRRQPGVTEGSGRRPLLGADERSSRLGGGLKSPPKPSRIAPNRRASPDWNDRPKRGRA